jgi:hypothetical protein
MEWLRLATRWEAIILLDDADVFLETRGTPGEKVLYARGEGFRTQRVGSSHVSYP